MRRARPAAQYCAPPKPAPPSLITARPAAGPPPVTSPAKGREPMTDGTTRAARLAHPLARDALRQITQDRGGCIWPAHPRPTHLDTAQATHTPTPRPPTLHTPPPAPANPPRPLRPPHSPAPPHLPTQPPHPPP